MQKSIHLNLAVHMDTLPSTDQSGFYIISHNAAAAPARK